MFTSYFHELYKFRDWRFSSFLLSYFGYVTEIAVGLLHYAFNY